MIILCDTRQQDKKHKQKEEWFASHGIEVRRTKLYVGDYTLPTDQSVCVDTKRDILELAGNVCGSKSEHERFRSECQRAKEAGIKLIVLIENDGGLVVDRNGIFIRNEVITDLSQLHKWTNPRLWIYRHGRQLYPHAVRGVTLMRACYTMQKKYSVEFQFCASADAGQRIVDLLTNGVQYT